MLCVIDPTRKWLLEVYYQKRKNGYSFVYFDTTLKKNVRLKKQHCPVIHTEEEAKAFCEQWDAKYDAMKLRRKMRIQWTERYHKFNEDLKKYLIYITDKAPNSWSNYMTYVRYYVFPFFLDLKDQHNINAWHFFFEEFRFHLENIKPVKKKVKSCRLSYSAINSVIKSLNSFIEFMWLERKIENNFKCRSFPKHKIKRRNETSVIEDWDQILIHRSLKEINWTAADMFHVAINTGLRLGELTGISMADLHSKEQLPETLKTALKPYNFTIYGCLLIDSQPENSNALRSASGEVKRKPLKGLKTIEGEELRKIPIFDKETYNILVHLWNEQQKEFERRRYGDNPKNYLLFNLNKNTFSHYLRRAQIRMKRIKCYSSHELRHTYCTKLNQITGENMELSKMILGHSDVETTRHYSHVNQRLKKHLETKRQLSLPMKYADEPKSEEVDLNQLYQKYQKNEPWNSEKPNDFLKVG